jgi:serine/threonine protein kinase
MLNCHYCGAINPAQAQNCQNCGSPIGDLALSANTLLQQGRYRITHKLGRGGFGITYAAWDTRFAAPVAIKELFPDSAQRDGNGSLVIATQNSSSFQKMLQHARDEAKVLSSLRHPGIVQVKDFFDERGTVFIVMELLQGQTLQARIRQGAVTEPEVIDWLEKLLEALRAIHQQGLLHRDIKPENIMLDPRYGPVVIDFGTALDAQTSKTLTNVALTPQYAPLEQYSGSSSIARGPFSDLYALGASFVEVLTGQPPPSATDRAQFTQPPLCVAGFSPALQALIDWAWKMRLDERPQSAQAMLDRLQLLRSTPTPPPITTAPVAVPPVQPAIPGNNANQTPTVYQPANTTQPPQKSPLGAILTAALAIGGGSVAAFLLLSKPTSTTNNANTTTTTAAASALAASGTTPPIWRLTGGEVTVARANLRSGPSPDTASLGEVKRYNQVRILAESSGWYQVEANGVTGWLKSNLLVATAPQVNRPEVVRLVNLARSGGDILLEKGVYLISAPLQITGNVSITGASRDQTFIVGRMGGSIVSLLGSGQLTLRDLTVGHLDRSAGVVVAAYGGSITLERVRLSGGRDNNTTSNDTHNGDGLALHNNASAIVRESEFTGNRWRGLGMYQNASSDVNNSEFKYNNGSGIVFFDNSSGTVANSRFYANGLAGIKGLGYSRVSVSNNRFEINEESALNFFEYASATLENNDCSDQPKYDILFEDNAQVKEGNNRCRVEYLP